MPTDPMTLTDEQLDALIASLGARLGIVFDTDPIEIF